MREGGYDAKELARAVDVSPAVLESWLAGTSRPGVTKLRKLSSVLRRPTATFLLPRPPQSKLPALDFRHPPGREGRALSHTERVRLREAVRLQRALSWVSGELKAAEVKLPKYSSRQDPEAAGIAIREQLGVDAETQTGWKSEYVAFREWRARVEAMNVVVLALPLGADSARGFSVWDERAPLIAVNTHWNAYARVFTLFHELGHLLSRTSSVCEEDFSRKHKEATDPIERWCEAFAASVLLPWGDAAEYLERHHHWDGRSPIRDLKTASALARKFKISVRATVLTLIGHDVAPWSLYRAIPKASEKKAEGGGGSGRSRAEARRDEYGGRTVSIIRRGLERDVLGPDDAIGYLSIGDSELQAFLSPALGR
ncbi:MAG: ImmA/IrrE family metallo-endopeptidase [Myxococcales bacterium]|nr:ImmA/IrrE family metallo-endopeptidase [Myxococcales bacterium]MCB9583612.1 ImmA/IrrE family metallo-endopeptidase [Polyangiaceae bacterium]